MRPVIPARIRAWFARRWQRWMDARLPPAAETVLTPHNVFVFPSRHGLLFAAITVLILIGSANYQNNMGLLLAFWLIGVGLLSIFISFRNLLGLRLRAAAAAPVFAGENAAFPLLLDSTRRTPHRGIGLRAGTQGCFADVESDLVTRVALALPAPSRGRLRLPRLCVESQAPFGWIRCWSWPAPRAETLVYPRPIAPEHAPRESGQSSGERGPLTPGTDDFYALRPWRSGDSLRQIDWKAFARERGLQVRQFVTASGRDLWLRLQDLPRADQELQLSWLSYLLIEAEHSGQRYGLDLNGVQTPPSQGDAHLHACLTQLALFDLPESAT